MKLLPFLLVFAIGIGLCAAGAVPPDALDTPPWQPAGRYTHPDIRESSGVVASHQFEGVFWTLNDSGNPAALYATKLSGELIQEIAVRGSLNSDWEALGIDKQGKVWIGEIGNNSRMRQDLKVIVIAEPDPFAQTEAEVIASYPYRYPDENVDAEGLFIAKGMPCIVSKEGSRAVLYRFPTLQPDTEHVLVRVGEFAGARLVTGAGLREDGTRLAVCTYDTLWVYHGTVENLAQMILGKPWVLTHEFRGEAVCFDGNALVLTNEARDIYHLPQFWYEKEWTLPPKDTLSAVTLFPTTEAHGGAVHIESYRGAGIDMGGSHVAFTSDIVAEPGVLRTQIDVAYGNLYKFSAILTRGPDYGRVKLSVNGTAVGAPYDCYSPELIAGTLVNFGVAELRAGENEIMLRCNIGLQAARKDIRKAAEAISYKIGIDSYQLLHASPFVQRFKVLGPFPRTDFNTVDTPLPPETYCKLNAIYEGVDSKPIRWQEAASETDGMLDLQKNIGMNRNVVGYALAYVYAPEEMDTVLLLGSDEAVAVWLNGTEIHRKNVYRRVTPDVDTVPCQLQAGWNEVLCKVGQSGWQWCLYLRFTDADGILRFGTQPVE